MSTQLIAHLKKKCEADDNVKILLSQWEFDQKLVGKALENIGGFYPHFSNHNASHSQQILVNIERILGNDINLLTATDTWLILEAAYWHDAGMLVDAEKAKKIDNESNFKNMLREIEQNKSSDLYEFAKVYLNTGWQGAIALEKHPFDGVEKYRQLIAEYFRKEHANRIGNIVLEDYKNLGINTPRTELLPTRLFRYLGNICVGHGMNFEKMMGVLPRCQTGLGTEDCHPLFVACLLRLGDLFDLDDNRFCPVMAKHVSNMPLLSRHHHNKHLSLREFQLDKRTVRLVAECPDEMSYVETQNWFEWIREEFQSQMSQWNLIVPNFEFSSLPTIEQLDVRMQIKNENGLRTEKILLNNKPMKFTLDEKNGMELLQGANLYKDEFSIYRELIQNAIDATMLRIWLEEDQEKIKQLHPYHPEFIEICKKYPIEINILKINSDIEIGNQLWEMNIKDNGIGISLKDLSYMQKMAGSNKNLEKKKIIESMPIWMRPSGEFGIGLHSAFLLCKSLSEVNQFIEFTTMNYFSNEKLKIEMNSPLGNKNGYCFITKIDNEKRKLGTEIKVRFISKFDFIPYYLILQGKGFNAIENNKIEFYKNIIYKRVLRKTPFFNKEGSEYKWDFNRSIAYKFSLNTNGGIKGSSIRFRGQEAKADNMMFINSLISSNIDYFGLKASDTLNISRDEWNGKFSKQIKEDLSYYLKKYVEDYSTVEKKFIDKLMGYNCDDSKEWRNYKIDFINKDLLISNLFLKEILFIENEFFEIIDEDVDSNLDIYVMSRWNISLLNRLFYNQIKREFDCITIFECSSFRYYDNERFEVTFYYTSPLGGKPPESINGVSLEWEKFAINTRVGSTYHDILQSLKNMRRRVEYEKDGLDIARKIDRELEIIRDKDFCNKYKILNLSFNGSDGIINPYQIEKNKIFLLDVNELALFLYSNRLENNIHLRESDFLNELNRMIEELDLIIRDNQLNKYFKQ